jgi:hypothetical protein
MGYLLGGKRWKRGGMYHMSDRPQRVVLHQQLGSQLQVQLNGLWIFSRRLRPMETILRCGLSYERRTSRRPTATMNALTAPAPAKISPIAPEVAQTRQALQQAGAIGA